jgi:hypothetical protein
MRNRNEKPTIAKLLAQIGQHRKIIAEALVKLNVDRTQLNSKLEKRDDYRIIAVEAERLKSNIRPTDPETIVANRLALKNAQESFNACSDSKESALKLEKIKALEELDQKLANIIHFAELRQSDNSSPDSWTRASMQIYTTAQSLATFGWQGAAEDPIKIAFSELINTLNKYDKDTPAMKGLTSSTKKIFNNIRELTESINFSDPDAENQPRKRK